MAKAHVVSSEVHVLGLMAMRHWNSQCTRLHRPGFIAEDRSLPLLCSREKSFNALRFSGRL